MVNLHTAVRVMTVIVTLAAFGLAAYICSLNAQAGMLPAVAAAAAGVCISTIVWVESR